MPDISSFTTLIRFLTSTGHLYLAFLTVLLLAVCLVLWGLKGLLPIRLNLSVGDRQELPRDKSK